MHASRLEVPAPDQVVKILVVTLEYLRFAFGCCFTVACALWSASRIASFDHGEAHADFTRIGSVKLCGAVSVVVTTVGLGVSAGWAQQPQGASGSHLLVAPTSPPRRPVGADREALRRFVAKRDEARRDKQAARDSEGERRERRASRTRYRDLDSAQARELARRHLKRAFERRDPVNGPGVSSMLSR